MNLKQPYLIDIEAKGAPGNGLLSVVEPGGPIPFEIKRLYWLYDVPDFGERGNHAHLTNEQVVVAMHGAVKVLLETPKRRKFEFELHRPNHGLFIPALYWRKIQFYDQAVVLVLSSKAYQENDYLKDYAEFRTLNRTPPGEESHG